MIPDYNIISSYLPNYEKQIDTILSKINKTNAVDNVAAPLTNLPTYFICFINRSGSTLLAQVLSRTNRMGRVGEIFNPEPIASTCHKNNFASMEAYINFQIQQTSRSSGVFGAKIGMHQLAYLAKYGYLANQFKNAKFIYVTRKDIIMQAVSLSIASQQARGPVIIKVIKPLNLITVPLL